MLCLRIWLLLSLVSLGRCLIEEIQLPPSLKECLMMKSKYQDVTKSPSESVCNNCITRFLWKEGPNLQKCDHPNDNITVSDISNYFGKLLHDEIKGKRTKRQAGKALYRKEIRMLTRGERLRLQRAWAKAYKSGYFGWLVRFHNDNSRNAAQSGPAFPGYYRFLLLILERILQSFDPEVSLPYWDTTVEANMDKPENSILWNNEYLGEINGFVNTGICGGFRDLRGNKIVRNGGNGGALFTHTNLTYVLNKQTIDDLVEDSSYDTMESLHGNVHNYVGGTMSLLELAPWDCVFWFQHAYIDYTWELWRYTHGYNIDYPYKPNKRIQEAEVPMENMPYIDFLGHIPTNKDGYGHQLASLTQYQMTPTCSQHNLYCGSPDLQCRRIDGSFRCTAVDRIFRHSVAPYLKAAQGGKVKLDLDDHHEGKRTKRDTTNIHLTTIKNTVSIVIQSTEITNIYFPQEHEPCMGKPIQNNFVAGCSKADVKRWAFIPIKVVHLRPKEAHFTSQSETNGNKNRYDMYDEHKYNHLKKLVRPGNPATYYNCQEDESGAFKVRLKSTGLSYFGAYTDYVFVDNRLPISSHIGYIAVEKPTSYTPTDALITASDACGRLCKPRCRQWVKGKLYYVPCSGAIRVTQQSPLMYGNDFGDGVLSIWEFNEDFTPIENESNIFMEFFCDYSNEWMWKQRNTYKR
ncbi:Hypothetical predicted protein [Mytilus galloprovincialis]|uniref:Tyrosinase copper-binding domain-containing protein n=1 Tax=Mytilus galloprovincialis TaxID=29158 RepID=A0A8B6FI79_MYTGA|nr:Hypothetical predicted protein [Mytilus galloprovincialis]